MPYFLLIAGVFISGVCTVLLIPAVCRLAFRRGWVDRPDNVRKLHARATPNIGGIAIAAGFVVGFGFLLAARSFLPFEMSTAPTVLWGGALVMVCAGFYDDVVGLSFKEKFLLQIIVAYLLIHAGYRIEVANLPFIEADPYQQALYSIPLTMLWIVGIINAVNLLDGLDGLAAGVALIAFTCLGAVFGLQGEAGLILVALPMVGALIGFLMHNFSPASVFMGDSGSLFLGFMLAAYSLQGQAHTDPLIAILVPVVALGLPVLDTGLSIARRLAHRKAICAPDHGHIHHRLVRRFSQRWAVLSLYAVATLFGAFAVLMTLADPLAGYLALSTLLILVCAGLRLLGYRFRRVLLRVVPQRFAFRASGRGGPVRSERGDGGAGETHEILIAGLDRKFPVLGHVNGDRARKERSEVPYEQHIVSINGKLRNEGGKEKSEGEVASGEDVPPLSVRPE